MPSSLDAAKAANAVDAMLATSAFVASTAPMRLRQMTAQGSATANGTELATSGGYTAGTGAPTVAFGAASTTTGQAASSGAVTITNMPATTIVAVEVWDSAGTPKRIVQGSLASSKTTASGDTLSYATGAVTVTVL